MGLLVWNRGLFQDNGPLEDAVNERIGGAASHHLQRLSSFGKGYGAEVRDEEPCVVFSIVS